MSDNGLQQQLEVLIEANEKLLHEIQDLREQKEKISEENETLRAKQQQAPSSFAQQRQPFQPNGNFCLILLSFTKCTCICYYMFRMLDNDAVKLEIKVLETCMTCTTTVCAGENLGGKTHRRASNIAQALNARASMGYKTQSLINENDILHNNIADFMRNFTDNIHIPENCDDCDLLYVQTIGCLMALFHKNTTLCEDDLLPDDVIATHAKNAPVDTARLLKIFAHVVKYMASLLINTSIDVDELPYPITWLFKLFPESMDVSVGRGWLPLHWYLATDNIDISDMLYMYKLYGEVAFQEAVSPLSILACSGHYSSTPEIYKDANARHPNYTVIVALLEKRPSAASERDADGSFSIMHACSTFQPSTDIIDLLYNYDHDSINKADKFGCYAIHYACYFGNVITVKYLLEKLPSSATFASGNGALPLHEAVQNISYGSMDLIIIVYNSYRDAIKISDKNGALPLHLAARVADIDVVKFLYDAYPEVRWLHWRHS